MTPSHLPPLVVFAPLPPQRNGIADYVAELAPFLARTFDCLYVVADDAPAPTPLAGAATLRLAEYERDEARFARAAHLYHVGNNPDHVYMLPVAMRRPGVLVLHDLTLHYLWDRATLAEGDMAGYRDQLVRELGGVGDCIGRQFEQFRWRGTLAFYGMPMNRQLVTRSKAVITHSAYGRAKIEALPAAPPVFRVPHHVAPGVPEAGPETRRAARAALDVPQDCLMLASVGFATHAKQIALTLEALARLRDRLPPFRYVIAGAKDEYYDVEADIRRLGLDEIVTVTGYVPDGEFFTYLLAADIVVNLRYPTGGETSGTLLRALGCGACTVTIDVGAFGEFPDPALVKLPWGPETATTLEAALLRLAEDPALRRSFGRNARRHVATEHAIERSAGLYAEAIRAAHALPVRPWAVDGAWEYGASSPRGAGPLWQAEAMVPFGAGHVAGAWAPDGAAAAALRVDLGFDDVVDLTADGTPYGGEAAFRAFDLVLLSGPASRAGNLGAVLGAANRQLKFGGVLVVDLRSADGFAGLPLGAEAVGRMLLDAGFMLVRYADGVAAADGPAQQLEYCCRAVKISEFAAPRVRLGPIDFGAVRSVAVAS